MADNTDCFDGEVWVVGNKIDFVGTKEEAKERKVYHLTGKLTVRAICLCRDLKMRIHILR